MYVYVDVCVVGVLVRVWDLNMSVAKTTVVGFVCNWGGGIGVVYVHTWAQRVIQPSNHSPQPTPPTIRPPTNPQQIERAARPALYAETSLGDYVDNHRCRLASEGEMIPTPKEYVSTLQVGVCVCMCQYVGGWVGGLGVPCHTHPHTHPQQKSTQTAPGVYRRGHARAGSAGAGRAKADEGTYGG